MKLITLFFTSVLMISTQASAANRVVTCEIDTNDGSYKGKCLFYPEEKGSFSLSNPTVGKMLLAGISTVSVEVVEKGVAEVRGLTQDGINSRWGDAKRSAQEKACWEGEDFKVCAW